MKTAPNPKWIHEAHSYAFMAEGSFVLVTYLKPVGSADARSYWITRLLSSRQELVAEYQDFVGTGRHHFLTAFDKTDAAWSDNCPVLSSGDLAAYARAGSPDHELSVNRDPKLLKLLDAARELVEVSDSGSRFHAHALDALEAAARAWTADECPICGRRGDHEWDELTITQRTAHRAEADAQGM